MIAITNLTTTAADESGTDLAAAASCRQQLAAEEERHSRVIVAATEDELHSRIGTPTRVKAVHHVGRLNLSSQLETDEREGNSFQVDDYHAEREYYSDPDYHDERPGRGQSAGRGGGSGGGCAHLAADYRSRLSSESSDKSGGGAVESPPCNREEDEEAIVFALAHCSTTERVGPASPPIKSASPSENDQESSANNSSNSAKQLERKENQVEEEEFSVVCESGAEANEECYVRQSITINNNREQVVTASEARAESFVDDATLADNELVPSLCYDGEDDENDDEEEKDEDETLADLDTKNNEEEEESLMAQCQHETEIMQCAVDAPIQISRPLVTQEVAAKASIQPVLQEYQFTFRSLASTSGELDDRSNDFQERDSSAFNKKSDFTSTDSSSLPEQHYDELTESILSEALKQVRQVDNLGQKENPIESQTINSRGDCQPLFDESLVMATAGTSRNSTKYEEKKVAEADERAEEEEEGGGVEEGDFMDGSNSFGGRPIYTSSMFYDDKRNSYPTLEQQVDRCRTIAKILHQSEEDTAHGSHQTNEEKGDDEAISGGQDLADEKRMPLSKSTSVEHYRKSSVSGGSVERASEMFRRRRELVDSICSVGQQQEMDIHSGREEWRRASLACSEGEYKYGNEFYGRLQAKTDSECEAAPRHKQRSSSLSGKSGRKQLRRWRCLGSGEAEGQQKESVLSACPELSLQKLTKPRFKPFLDSSTLKDIQRLRAWSPEVKFNEHNSVSPEICAKIAEDLRSSTRMGSLSSLRTDGGIAHSSPNKGAQMFERRQLQSSDWIVGASTQDNLLPPSPSSPPAPSPQSPPSPSPLPPVAIKSNYDHLLPAGLAGLPQVRPTALTEGKPFSQLETLATGGGVTVQLERSAGRPPPDGGGRALSRPSIGEETVMVAAESTGSEQTTEFVPLVVSHTKPRLELATISRTPSFSSSARRVIECDSPDLLTSRDEDDDAEMEEEEEEAVVDEVVEGQDSAEEEEEEKEGSSPGEDSKDGSGDDDNLVNSAEVASIRHAAPQAVYMAQPRVHQSELCGSDARAEFVVWKWSDWDGRDEENAGQAPTGEHDLPVSPPLHEGERHYENHEVRQEKDAQSVLQSTGADLQNHLLAGTPRGEPAVVHEKRAFSGQESRYSVGAEAENQLMEAQTEANNESGAQQKLVCFALDADCPSESTTGFRGEQQQQEGALKEFNILVNELQRHTSSNDDGNLVQRHPSTNSANYVGLVGQQQTPCRCKCTCRRQTSSPPPSSASASPQTTRVAHAQYLQSRAKQASAQCQPLGVADCRSKQMDFAHQHQPLAGLDLPATLRQQTAPGQVAGGGDCSPLLVPTTVREHHHHALAGCMRQDNSNAAFCQSCYIAKMPPVSVGVYDNNSGGGSAGDGLPSLGRNSDNDDHTHNKPRPPVAASDNWTAPRPPTSTYGGGVTLLRPARPLLPPPPIYGGNQRHLLCETIGCEAACSKQRSSLQASVRTTASDNLRVESIRRAQQCARAGGSGTSGYGFQPRITAMDRSCNAWKIAKSPPFMRESTDEISDELLRGNRQSLPSHTVNAHHSQQADSDLWPCPGHKAQARVANSATVANGMGGICSLRVCISLPQQAHRIVIERGPNAHYVRHAINYAPSYLQ